MSGTVALIAAYGDEGVTGAGYIFSETSPGAWTQVAKLTAADGAAGDYVRVRSVLHCPRWHGVCMMLFFFNFFL